MRLKSPKRPKTDKSGNAVRHVPRNAYNRCSIDSLLKYFYKYSFHHFCTKFVIYVDGKRLHTINLKDMAGYSLILETVNTIYQETKQVRDGNELYAGIPVLESGVICHYNPLDDEDPYHTCTIKLTTETKTPSKPVLRTNEVIYVGK